ncbi:Retrovirus-related Pol polyprotein from transposon 17.6 [Formica fusca]
MLMPQVSIEEIKRSETEEINVIRTPNKEEVIPRSEKVLRLLCTQHLNKEEKKMIMEICKDFSDVMHIQGEPRAQIPSRIRFATQANSSPVNVRPYRLPEKHNEEVNRQVREMLKNGIIRSSTNQWNAPLLVVPKKADASGKPQYKSDVQTENNSRAHLRHRKRIKCNSRDRNPHHNN